MTINGEQYWAYYLPAEQALKIAVGNIEINICLIKEPVAPGNYSPADLPPSAHLPGATLDLEALRGSAL